MKIKIMCYLPINKRSGFSEYEVNDRDEIIKLVKRLGKQNYWAVMLVMNGDELEYFRYDGTKLFYESTIKRWISKDEYKRLVDSKKQTNEQKKGFKQ